MVVAMAMASNRTVAAAAAVRGKAEEITPALSTTLPSYHQHPAIPLPSPPMSTPLQPEPHIPSQAAALLRTLDVFPKVADEARARSASGGITTLTVTLCILLLVISEARLYSSIRTDETLEVDVTRGGKVAVDFNVTFHHLPCSLMSVDSMDISGVCVC